MICARSTLAWRRQDGALWIDRHGVYSWMRLRSCDTLQRERSIVNELQEAMLSLRRPIVLITTYSMAAEHSRRKCRVWNTAFSMTYDVGQRVTIPGLRLVKTENLSTVSGQTQCSSIARSSRRQHQAQIPDILILRINL